MAPSTSYDVTQISTVGTPTNQTGFGLSRYVSNYNYVSKKVETKRERIKRVAKERMYASWKTYNDKTETIKEIKQICRPQHKLNHMGRRS
jgi:hypothetical protein